MKNTILLLLLSFYCGYSQTQMPPGITTTPNGMFDNVYDRFGNQYNILDLKINTKPQDAGTTNKPTLINCNNTSIFNLWFDDNSGMQGTTPLESQRRAVVCQVFQDISNFINTPLKTSINPTTGLVDKVNIWVMNSPTNPVILGQASDFYNTPQTPTVINGGIIDGEVWKTLHTGRNSWENVASPLNSGFYHGTLAINWNHNWNLSLTAAATGSDFDLYTVVLHEVLHSLGFASLISDNGLSILGVGNNYYTRYDTHLIAPNDEKLIANTGSCSEMYNYNFNVSSNNLHPNNPVLGTDHTNCPTAIRYSGTSTGLVPIYTPTLFENGSSLSHFEDECLNPSQNNSFFVMSNVTVPISTKRFIKNQERNTLGELGYCLNTMYGVTTTPSFNDYTGSTITPGIRVAGINDGLTTTGYAYSGATGTDITITGILLNDIVTSSTGTIVSNSLLRFQCVEDVYFATGTNNPVLTTDTFTKITTNGNLNTSTITFRSMVPGLHLLRYVPFMQSSSINIGNISYIFIYVTNNCAIPTDVCNLVLNGGFEQNSFVPNNSGQIDFACNWSNGRILTSSDYFRTNAFSASYGIPINDLGNQPVNNGIGNAYAGLWSLTNFQELLKTTLTNPLANNTNYQLSFDVAIYNANSRPLNPSEIQACFTNNSIPILNVSLPQPNELFMGTGQVVTANTPNNWRTLTFNFTTTNGGQQDLYIGAIRNTNFQIPPNLSNVSGAYYYIDNVKLFPTNNYTFNLPTEICASSTISNLSNYLTSGTAPNGVFTGPGVTSSGSAPNIIYSFNPYGLSGLQTITYNYTSGSCSIPLADTINVNGPSMAGILTGNNSDVCLGVTPAPTFTSTVAGGTWQSSDTSVATITATGEITAIAVGTTTLTYTVNSNNCSNSNTLQINVTSCGTSNCSGALTLIAPDTHPTAFTYRSDSTIVTQTNYIVNSPTQDITMYAQNSITLKPNTFIGSGSKYLGKIVSCSNINYKNYRYSHCMLSSSLNVEQTLLSQITLNGINNPIGQISINATPLPTGITIDNTSGVITVQATVLPGSYIIPFTACVTANPTNCITNTFEIIVEPLIIIANDDTINLSLPNYDLIIPYHGILDNDILCENKGALLSNVTISNISSTSPNVSINTSTGLPTVNSGTPAGIYSIVYQICAYGFCDTATVTVIISLSNKKARQNKVTENIKFSEIKVSPNPSNGLFTITFDKIQKEPIKISVYDMLGKKVIEKDLENINSIDYQLDLSNYTSGTYLLNIENVDNSVFRGKLIKN